ncbi:regulatory protein LuxR [Oscillochloris trichoides DG-6]|uniref:Regulatory protein LuxR n=1 Tax=Oscillochloris trichoides DG-6 TaxID=765420 RepID=E1IIQ6_9CHLR|nr:helix-turn-helix domain-containing protein [Oscillochloris trichoides]EFO78912.1 regulatory protein LuxR [Oscillochloris trichoides DG-6]
MSNENPISEREREILKLVATGASNQQIAQQLNISVNTVKVHVRNIFSKTGVMSRTEATIYAINHGFVVPERFAPSPANNDSVLIDTPQDEPPAPTVEPETVAEIVDPGDSPPNPASIPANHPSLPVSAPRMLWPRLVGALVLLVVVISGGLLWAKAEPVESPTPVLTPSTVSSNDPDQRWFSRAPMPQPRAAFAITAYDIDRKLYVIGGSIDGQPSAAIDRFDPENNLWVSLSNKPTAVSHIGAAVLRGNIYVPGGIDASGQVRDILEIFDPREQRWHTGAALPGPRSNYALVAWEGQLYLIGGWDGTQVRSEVYIYDPQRDAWSTGPTLPSPRQDAGATVVAGQIYVVGGSDGSVGLRESIVLEASGRQARWISMTPLPQAIATPSVHTTISAMLVFDPAQHQSFQYNQSADAWHSVSLPDNADIAHTSSMLGGSIYFITPQGQVQEYRVLYTIFVPATGTNY